MAGAMRPSGVLNPNAIRVMSRIVVFTNTIRPLDRPCSMAARIESLRLVILRCRSTNAGIRQRRAHLP